MIFIEEEKRRQDLRLLPTNFALMSSVFSSISVQLEALSNHPVIDIREQEERLVTILAYHIILIFLVIIIKREQEERG